MTNLEQTQEQDKTRIEALPLPQKNEQGFYEIAPSETGKQLSAEIKNVVDLQHQLRRGEENTPEQIQVRQNYEQALANFAVHTGRALGVLPPWSDETLVKEAGFQPHETTDAVDVLINSHGNVALTFQTPFGSRDNGYYVDFGMFKQGEKTALKASSSILIAEDGSITFKPDRHEDDTWGSIENLITVESGRVVSSVAAIPSTGVFSQNHMEYWSPSKHTSAFPMDLKINSWKPFTNETYTGDNDYKSTAVGLDVRGKHINYEKVLSHMRESGFNGNKEITDHKGEITQFLE